MRLQPFLPALLASVLASSCLEILRTPGVMLASTPPGARVIVDGTDSGFVTPCHLDLPREAQDVDLVLDGYRPASVRIDADGETWLILWDESWLNEQVWRFPLWLNTRDGLFPVKKRVGYSPERIYVKLQMVQGQDRPRRGGGGR